MNNKFKTICGVDIFLGILSLVLPVQMALAETRFTNEVWISTSPNTANYGTLDNPFDGSTQAKFDSVLSNTPPNTTIHLLAGTYQTLGSAYYGKSEAGPLKTGQKIRGSGIDATILRLVPGTVSGAGDTIVLTGQANSACSNVEVCDLTCDCNYTPGTSETYDGIILFGTQNAVRRVKVINQATYGGRGEAFGIGLNSTTNIFIPDGAGNIIEECEVSQYAGGENYGGELTAMEITGGSGIMRNNRVILSPNIGAAFNNSSTHDLLIEGNYVDGAGVGVYGDTGGSTNMIIAHNNFRNCGVGVEFENNGGNSNVRRNITIAFNNINLADGNGRYGIVLNIEALGYCTNISIIGNTFSLKDQGTGTAYALDLNNYVNGIIYANNMVDASMINYFAGCTNVSIFNNYDLYGNVLTNLNQVASLNGVTRRTVAFSGFTTNWDSRHKNFTVVGAFITTNAAYTDKYIGVQGLISGGSGAGGVIVVLPSSVGHAGKDFIVADESGQINGSSRYIQILPTSPDKINGQSAITNITPYAGMTAVSDGTNWFVY